MKRKDFGEEIPGVLEGNAFLFFGQRISIVVFAVFLIFLASGNVFAYNIEGNGNCNCGNCGDCTDALNDNANCNSKVKLNQNITDVVGTCINNPANFNNKIFDCQGHTIEGDGSGYDQGIFLDSRQNNTIRNCIIRNFSYGIYLSSSSNNFLTNNTLTNNTYNFGIYGYEISHFYQDIDKSNLVDNKPIYYWTNEKNAPNGCKNAVISDLNNTGFVALVSCDNITVKNLNLHNNSHGILLVNTTNSKILNNTANLNGYEGISLHYYSSNNSLTNNTANLNNVTGIYIFGNSNFNKILNNKILNNGKTGITLSNCGFWGHCYDNAGNSNNKIKDNKILNNNVGIFSHQSNSTINNNVVCRNANLDFNSSAWQSSSGDNNTCNNSDGWNDTSVTGCKISCNCINFDFDNDNKVDIFDVVAGLEHLKEEKMIYNKWCSARNYNEIDLFDLLILIEKIGMNTV